MGARGDSVFQGFADRGERDAFELALEFEVLGDAADVDAENARAEVAACSLEAREDEVEQDRQHFLLSNIEPTGRNSVPRPSKPKEGQPDGAFFDRTNIAHEFGFVGRVW